MQDARRLGYLSMVSADSNGSVPACTVQFAVMGAVRHDDVRALPRIAQLLTKHSSEAVRSASIQALMRFGSRAKPYLGQLRAARETESSDVLKVALAKTITALEK